MSAKALDELADTVRGYVTDEVIGGGELMVIKNRHVVLHEVFGDLDRDLEIAWEKNTDLLLKRGKIDQSLVTQMLGWNHSGFGVHHAVRLDADDRAGRERLTQYMLRCPFSLERMIRVTAQGKVIYLAEKRACRRFPKPASRDLFNGVSRNFQVFDPVDFIAEQLGLTAV